TAVGPVAGRLVYDAVRRLFRLLDQGAGIFVIGRVARQHVHGGDELLVGVHRQRALVPVEALAGPLAPMAQLRISGSGLEITRSGTVPCRMAGRVSCRALSCA